LDQATAIKVFDLMLDLNHYQQTALVMVTHDQQLAAKMNKVMILKDGLLE
jgi:lipoprotein-releasing system ATP-binding protein